MQPKAWEAAGCWDSSTSVWGSCRLTLGHTPLGAMPVSAETAGAKQTDLGSSCISRVTWNNSLALQSLGGKTRCPLPGNEMTEHRRDRGQLLLL